jgi:hypothetical protein
LRVISVKKTVMLPDTTNESIQVLSGVEGQKADHGRRLNWIAGLIR